MSSEYADLLEQLRRGDSFEVEAADAMERMTTALRLVLECQRLFEARAVASVALRELGIPLEAGDE